MASPSPAFACPACGQLASLPEVIPEEGLRCSYCNQLLLAGVAGTPPAPAQPVTSPAGSPPPSLAEASPALPPTHPLSHKAEPSFPPIRPRIKPPSLPPLEDGHDAPEDGGQHAQAASPSAPRQVTVKPRRVALPPGASGPRPDDETDLERFTRDHPELGKRAGLAKPARPVATGPKPPQMEEFRKPPEFQKPRRKKKRRKLKEEPGSRRQKQNKGLLALLTTLAVLVVGSLIGWILWSMQGASPRLSTAPPPELAAAKGETGATTDDGTGERFDERAYEAAARAFVEAGAQDRAGMIRDAGRFREQVLGFAPEIGVGDVVGLQNFGRAEMDESVHQYLVRFSDGRYRLVLVVEEDGALKVDWAAFARLGTNPIDDLRSGRAPRGEFRVTASSSTYYNNDFRDDERWLAVTISNPDWGAMPLTAYAERDTLTAQAVTAGLSAGKPPVRFIFRLAVPENAADDDQFLIEEVVALGWWRADETYEDRLLQEEEDAALLRRLNRIIGE